MKFHGKLGWISKYFGSSVDLGALVNFFEVSMLEVYNILVLMDIKGILVNCFEAIEIVCLSFATFPSLHGYTVKLVSAKGDLYFS